MNIKPEIAWGSIAVCVALFIALFFSIQLGVLTLLFALASYWMWEYPEASLLLFIALSPLLPMFKATQTLGNITLIKDVFIIILFLKTFLVPLLEQRLPYRKNLLFAPIIALTGWVLVSAAQSHSTLAVLRVREIVLYILLYFGVLYLPHTKKIMRTRAMIFFATLVIVMLLGVFQFMVAPDSTVLRFDPVRQIWIPRMASTFGHPTVFAEYLITGAILVASILLHSRVIPDLIRNPRRKILLGALLLATIILLYFTYTRAAWIGFVGGIAAVALAWLMQCGKYHINKIIVISVGIGSLLIVAGLIRFTPVGTFLRTAIDPNYASNADRIGFFVQLTAQTSTKDVLIGKGLGNVIAKPQEGGNANITDIASGASRTIQLSKDQTLVDNQYLKTFIEMGVVGVVLTFWLFWRFFIACKEAVGSNNTQSKILSIAGIGFLAAFMIQALFVDIWDVFPTNALFWIFAALLMSGSPGQARG